MRYIYINDRVKTISHFTPDMMIGKTNRELGLDGPELEYWEQNSRDVIDSGKPRIIQLLFPCISAEKQFFELHLIPETDASNQFSRLLVMVRNITTQKQVEHEKTLLSTVVQQSAETIIITNSSGTIEYVNSAFERMTGYSSNEAIGCTPRILRSHKQDDSFYAEMWNSISQGEIWSRRLTNKRKDGTLYEGVMTISPIRNSIGQITNYVGVQYDITKELALEQQLMQSQKLEAVGTLAGGIAHEFNNIIQIISGYTHVALKKVSDDFIHDCLDEIRVAGNRARDLVEQLLTFSRPASTEHKSLPITPIIRESIRMMRATLPKTIDILQTIDEDCGNIMGDATQIHQVMLNLLNNSAHAIAGNIGVIIVTLQKITISHDSQDHAGLGVGEFVVLKVGDTGSGIVPDVMEHIFEPFFTTKEVGKGSGLGLSIVHGIIKRHGGAIKVDSVPGSGTTISMYFPACEVPVLTYESSESEHPHGDGRLLMIDDEESIARMFKVSLEAYGYEVTAMSDADKALAHFRQFPEKFDLVLTDQTMPMTDGIRLSIQLLKIRQNIPIILLTGYSDMIDETAILKTGIRKFFMKPVNFEKLAREIHEILTMSSGVM
ncbi:MAG: PAS domain S-box protein [SAR324 cluster bacterium]|nr:PAS domain S-box protein [SAR324 cluster bacterium]